MKVIALIPFRNEALFLPLCLQSLQGIADEILGYDDGSTDDSQKIFESFGGVVCNRPLQAASWGSGKEVEIRNILLDWAREREGTHFICLDADEALTNPFRSRGRAIMDQLQPGHKLLLQWLSTWKDPKVYRCDPPLWNEPYKDFIIRDDPSLPSFTGCMHVARTHGQNDPDKLHKLPLQDGAVLHFQYAAWGPFQMKQCWYRCLELRKMPGGEELLNDMYSASLDAPEALCCPLPESWISGFEFPDVKNLPLSWHYAEIMSLFDEMGAEFFEGLDIWHVPELRQAFIERCGREPDQQKVLRGMRIKRKIKEACKKILPNYCVSIIRRFKNRYKLV